MMASQTCWGPLIKRCNQEVLLLRRRRHHHHPHPLHLQPLASLHPHMAQASSPRGGAGPPGCAISTGKPSPNTAWLESTTSGQQIRLMGNMSWTLITWRSCSVTSRASKNSRPWTARVWGACQLPPQEGRWWVQPAAGYRCHTLLNQWHLNRLNSLVLFFLFLLCNAEISRHVLLTWIDFFSRYAVEINRKLFTMCLSANTLNHYCSKLSDYQM